MTRKITKRSVVQFQFGDDQPEFPLDVIEVVDRWYEVNFRLRVQEGDMWVLPTGKVNEFAVDRLNFVQELVNEAYAKLGRPAPTISRIEAEEFIEAAREEAEKLRNFTSTKSVATSSAPESSAVEPTFSQ